MMMGHNDVLDLLGLVLVQSQCPVVPERHSYPVGPLGKTGRKINSIKFWQFISFLPQGSCKLVQMWKLTERHSSLFL